MGDHKIMKRFILLMFAVLTVTSIGCVRPFDAPEFAEIQHHETGYLIPLEGASKDGQAKFDSIEALDKNRVAIKRIQIPHRWVQKGRVYFGIIGRTNGDYIDTVRLVVVNRSPVTREWTADKESGTSNKDQAIWLESKDSIGFSLGFNCTAYIDEPDSTKFLYMYPTTTAAAIEGVDKSTTGLAHTMDNEIRARVQMLGNYVAAKYDLDDLRARKQEILDVVRNGVPEQKDADGNIIQERLQGTVEHFAARGITITNLGQFGGFEYAEPKIQDAINDTFVSQQEKVKTEAAFEAQAKVNERIELAAQATANQARTIAEGKADAVKTAANAQADAIRQVAAATKEAGKDPLFLELKKLEVENQRIAKWDGKYPTSLMSLGGGSDSPDLLLNVPIGAASPQ
jgi:hypothetical protein